MRIVQSILGDVELWRILAPVLTVVMGWLLNERARRSADRERRFVEQFERKERSYRTLLQASKGFMVGQPDASEHKEAFLDELQLCWLHASDDVIRKAYAFLATVHTDAAPHHDKEKAFAEFVATLRQDALSETLITKTTLRGLDYRFLKVA